MADIDLIPQSYRNHVRARRTVCRTACALAAVAFIVMAAGSYLHWQLNSERGKQSKMREQASDVPALKTRVEAKRAELLRRSNAVQALAMLRGRGEVAMAFRAMEMALHDNVALSRILFNRAYRGAEPGASQTASNTAAGQLAAGNVSQGGQAWLLPARLELQGESSDHAALAAFIKVASKAPGIADIRFQSSVTQGGAPSHGIEFFVEARIGQQGAAL